MNGVFVVDEHSRKVTLARDLLAPFIAATATGRYRHDDGLHCRCVLLRDLDQSTKIDDLSAHVAAATGEAIEAVALCNLWQCAVVVFRKEASVAIAVKTTTTLGRCNEVGPLYNATIRSIRPQLVEVVIYPSTPSGAVMRLTPTCTQYAPADTRFEQDIQTIHCKANGSYDNFHPTQYPEPPAGTTATGSFDQLHPDEIPSHTGTTSEVNIQSESPRDSSSQTD
ncbi:uncharacterized protein LOC107304065 [Oryza brachyantha]|uniref:uncharacterized protein LOC107304065 n=1 Tax=Oryza brachyantha TaxID=4533 RepID=UPI0007767F64|nr:uncharacterized protein LOC107304065 [Oryza brachyantha]